MVIAVALINPCYRLGTKALHGVDVAFEKAFRAFTLWPFSLGEVLSLAEARKGTAGKIFSSSPMIVWVYR